VCGDVVASISWAFQAGIADFVRIIDDVGNFYFAAALNKASG